MSTISFNPSITTVASGTFNAQSTGLIQGTAYADPAARYALSGGVLASTETLPLWGGVGVSLAVPTPGSLTVPNETLGQIVSRAINLTANTTGTLLGFSTFDQSHNWITTPQSPVPLAGSGNSVNFYRLGSGIRIAVAIDPALVSLEGGLETAQVSWDFGAQRLAKYQAAYAANVITAASWASTSGGQVTFTTTTNHGVGVGASFSISGMTPSGYNGNFVAITGTATKSLVAALASNPGTSTVQGTLVAGGGALPVNVLDVNIGNSMTVNYDPVTGFASWNRSGSAAVILI